jgi:hypothetical protein
MSDAVIAAPTTGTSAPGSRLDLDLANAGQLVELDAAWPSYRGCLRPAAEAAIIDWARRQPKDAPLGILVRLPASAMEEAEKIRLAEAVSARFQRLAEEQEYTAREFLADARRSAAVGFAIFAACLFTIWTLYSGYQGSTTARAIRDTLSILGWIAAWKPLEMLVHERRPILRRLRLLRRLAAAEVRVTPAVHP